MDLRAFTVHPFPRRLAFKGLASAVILAWWVCTLILKPEGYGWVVQTVIAWFALILIASSFFSVKRWTRSLLYKYHNVVRLFLSRIPFLVRLGFGGLVVVGIFLSFIFGFQGDDGTSLKTRARPFLGVFIFQMIFCITSANRSKIHWPTIVVGLILQQIIALFALKTRAGFDIFDWIVTVVEEFFDFDIPAKIFFWSEDIVDQQWFIVNITGAVVLFLAFVELLYHFGVMEWIVKKLAWIFFNIMNISGAEAVVAVASPVFGQGDAACLVKPYMNLMTRSELHLVLTSGYSTVSGTFIPVYVSLGVPPGNLITSSAMSIPAAIAISKMRWPEIEEPVTRGTVVVDRGEDKTENVLHALLKGAKFGLYIAGQIIANTLVFLSLLNLVNALLTWIGLGFGIHNLTLQLIFGYIFYPLAFLIGVPHEDILPVARLLGTKFVANELLAYKELEALMETDAALSPRGYTITTYALCGFANLSSLAVTAVIGALAPSRSAIVVKLAPSALLCGFLTTMQTAAIAGMLSG